MSVFKSDILPPLMPHPLLNWLRPRFDLQQMLNASPIRNAFTLNQLGKDLESARRLSNQLGNVFADHRRNQQSALSISRRGMSTANYAGYHRVQMLYPFTDRRLLEFCLALPGDYKVRNGYKRHAIRAGMRGLVPDSIRFRTTKEPFSPDFNDRYNRDRHNALAWLQATPKTDLIREVVDIEKLTTMLQYDMQTNRCNTPNEFAAMHSAPRGLYLTAFLSTFR